MPDDKEMVQDLIVAAINIALQNVEVKSNEEIKKTTEGMMPNIPGFRFQQNVLMARISIVILNYNGKHFLEQFLPSVLKYSAGHEVVVADNHSTDGSLKFLMHHPKVKVLAFIKIMAFVEDIIGH
jgi:hypothetical protein